MITRRLAGLLLAGFMLHLNFERADLACAAHARHANVAPANYDQASLHHVMNGAEHGGPTKSQNCQTPMQPDCCLALASCSLVLAVEDASQRVTSALSQGVVLAAVQTAPLSRLVAPDPPPPKL